MSLTETPDEFDSPRASGAGIRSNPSGIRTTDPDSAPPPGFAGTPLADSASLADAPDAPPEPTAGPPRGAGPGAAAVLSMVFPGLGQLFAGATRRGLVVAMPTVAVIIVIAAALGSGT